MSCINVTDVQVLNNPAMFTDDLQFEISFECIAPLKEDLEWKMIYVGSADDDTHDQELESVLVGPVEMGLNRFVFQGDAPNPALIPKDDLLGVTVVLVTCSYRDKEFIRIGYYIQNDYDEATRAHYDEHPELENSVNLVHRKIVHDAPRVTRFHISWDDEPASPQQPQSLLNQETPVDMGIPAMTPHTAGAQGQINMGIDYAADPRQQPAVESMDMEMDI
eukprot:TRINITY_DN34334_c0_g1_i1.p1 TRINITY_DN34334_c0_g1~~TRINITY_DN34334_c0_g1_i1.p1  ORF type:complete len:220 (-),score=34.48 TRINITY_DN34334_c0_g1_i1:87-746(-)